MLRADEPESRRAERQMGEQRTLIQDSHLAFRHTHHADGNLMNEIHLKSDIELMYLNVSRVTFSGSLSSVWLRG